MPIIVDNQVPINNSILVGRNEWLTSFVVKIYSQNQLKSYED
jgi:hypothetical protein